MKRWKSFFLFFSCLTEISCFKPNYKIEHCLIYIYETNKTFSEYWIENSAADLFLWRDIFVLALLPWKKINKFELVERNWNTKLNRAHVRYNNRQCATIYVMCINIKCVYCTHTHTHRHEIRFTRNAHRAYSIVYVGYIRTGPYTHTHTQFVCSPKITTFHVYFI